MKTSGIILVMLLFFAPLIYGSAEKIDLNTATEKELISLPGIGREIAKRIIEYREIKGGFKNKEELTNVKGIGEKRFAAIKELVVIKDRESSQGGKETPK